jgi:hypothetical protein
MRFALCLLTGTVTLFVVEGGEELLRIKIRPQDCLDCKLDPKDGLESADWLKDETPYR